MGYISCSGTGTCKLEIVQQNICAGCRKSDLYTFNAPTLILLCGTSYVYSLERSNI